MNLKLNEWNTLCEYTNKVCEELKQKGYNTKVKPYTMYDGRKGISLQVFDNSNNLFKEYNSGVYDSLSVMKENIDKQAKRIITEC